MTSMQVLDGELSVLLEDPGFVTECRGLSRYSVVSAFRPRDKAQVN